MMRDELKPCPFCGSDHIVESVGTKAGGEPWPYIECFGCSASAEPDVWNSRADSPDLATLRQQLADAVRERDAALANVAVLLEALVQIQSMASPGVELIARNALEKTK